MKSVLISVKPKWCEKITSGEKTIEVRKTAPKEVPFKAYIYETYDKKYDDIGICWGNGKCFEHGCKKVIGEFVCDKVEKFDVPYPAWNKAYLNDIFRNSCLTYTDLHSYIGSGNSGYGWHISDLKIYDNPRKLSEFKISCNRKYLCYSCNRFTGKPWDICNNTITRPPQSYMFVEEA